jgi:hypothetical protein
MGLDIERVGLDTKPSWYRDQVGSVSIPGRVGVDTEISPEGVDRVS